MEAKDILFFFGKIVIAAMIIPIVAAMINWKKLDRTLKYFFFYCLATFILSLGEVIFIWHVRAHYEEYWKPILAFWGIGDTHFLQILFFLRDYLLLGWFFSSILRPLPISKWVWWTALLLTIISTLNYFFGEGFREPGVFNPTSDAIFCFIVPMIGMWYLFHNDSKIAMYKNPVFWISLGLILPNLMSLFLYFTSDFLQKEDYTLYVNLMLIKNSFEIIGIILLTIGFAHAYYMRFFYPEPSK